MRFSKRRSQSRLSDGKVPDPGTSLSAPFLKKGLLFIATEMSRARAAGTAALFAGLLWTTAMVGGPLLIRQAIDAGILKGRLSTSLLFAGLIVLVGVVQGAASAIRRYNAFKMAYRVETGARARLFEHLQRLHLAFHSGFSSGQLISRAASDLQQVSNFCVNIPITLASLLIVALSLGLMFYLSWPLASISAGVLLFFLALTRWFNARTSPVSLSLQQNLGKMASLAEQLVRGIRTIKGLGVEDALKERASQAAEEIRQKAIEVATLRSMYNPLQPFASALSLSLTAGVGSYLAARSQVAPGTLVAFLVYLNMLNTPLSLIAFTLSLVPRSAAAAARVAEILQVEPQIKDPPKPLKINRSSDPLEVIFEGISFKYPGSKRWALEDFDLKIARGQSVALVGPSGSGKTTVVNLLARFYDPDEGRILFDEIDIKRLRLSDLRRQIGFVFEDSYLFAETVFNNIAFGKPEASFKEVQEAAKIAGAHEFIEALPDGYFTDLNQQGLSLSGGQRQRIAIARAVLLSPRMLVLDDATSALDPVTENEILAALSHVLPGRTCLIIAHRLSTARLAGRIVFLKEGRIVACGSHEELLDTCQEYSEFIESFTKGVTV